MKLMSVEAFIGHRAILICHSRRGKGYSDVGSTARSAVYMNGSVMLIHCPLDQTQAQAGSVSAIGARGVGAIEPLKNVWNGFRRNADAVVCHLENCVSRIA